MFLHSSVDSKATLIGLKNEFLALCPTVQFTEEKALLSELCLALNEIAKIDQSIAKVSADVIICCAPQKEKEELRKQCDKALSLSMTPEQEYQWLTGQLKKGKPKKDFVSRFVILGTNRADLFFYDNVRDCFNSLISDQNKETQEIGNLLKAYVTGSPSFSDLNGELLSSAGVDLEKAKDKLMVLSILSAFETKQLPCDFSLAELSEMTKISESELLEKLFVLISPTSLAEQDDSEDVLYRYAELTVNMSEKTVTVRSAQPRLFTKENWQSLKTMIENSKCYLTELETGRQI